MTLRPWRTNPVTVTPNGPGAAFTRKQELRITQPAAESHFVFTGEPGGDQVLLQSSLDGLAPIYWYLDGRYLGASKPDAPLYLPLEVGPHELTCLADEGATDAIRFEVLTPGEEHSS